MTALLQEGLAISIALATISASSIRCFWIAIFPVATTRDVEQIVDQPDHVLRLSLDDRPLLLDRTRAAESQQLQGGQDRRQGIAWPARAPASPGNSSLARLARSASARASFSRSSSPFSVVTSRMEPTIRYARPFDSRRK